MRTLSVDTETKGLRWFDPAEQAFLVSWSDDTGDYACEVDDEAGLADFRAALDRADRIVCHNLPFDVHQLRETIGLDLLELGKPCIDTVQLCQVVMPERRFAEGTANGFKLKDLAATIDPSAKDSENALKELAKEHGVKMKEVGGYYALHLLDPDAMIFYAKMDTRSTLNVLEWAEAKIGTRYARVWDIERNAQPHLIRAEARGVRVDQAKVIALHAKYEARRDEAYAELVKAFGPDVFSAPDDTEPESPEVLLAAMLSYGIPLTRMTKSGTALSTDKFALQEHEPNFPILKTLADYRQAKKFLSTYTGAMLGREVVHPSFSQQGAWTGRMSCSRPNMQNLPVRGEGASELRSMFIPREGHCFVVSDFDQIELRFLAYYLNGQSFIEKIENGDDVFAELAARLAVEMKYADEFGTDPANYCKGQPGAEHRVGAKNTVYAISYGAGRKRISDMLDLDPLGVVLTPKGMEGGVYKAGDWMVKKGFAEVGAPMYMPAYQVIKMVKSWLPNYFELAGPNGRIQDKVKAVEHVNTFCGRKQPVGRDKAYVGLNAIIQGSAADAFKLAVTAAAEAIAPLGALPVLFVHDEIVSECPIEYAKECQRRQDAAMAGVVDIRPALKVSGSIAYNDYSEGK